MCLTLLTEFIGSFAYGPSRSRQRGLQNTLQRLGDKGNKHGHLLRRPCDCCLAILISRVPLENSHYAVSDIVARDLISSYFRFPWEVTFRDFCVFARGLRPPRRSVAHPGYLPGLPTRATPGVRGMLRNRWRGSYPSFS
jgi:hypothetical protein